MPHSRYDWHDRIKDIEQEFRLTSLGLVRLGRDIQSDPVILKDVRNASRSILLAIENVEGTYLIRMFAEFEHAVRSYYRTISGMKKPMTKDLLDRIGSRRTIPGDLIRNVHTVRNRRNGLIHESAKDIELVKIADARGRLSRFLGYLPDEWGQNSIISLVSKHHDFFDIMLFARHA